jgi:hypothetical protein
MRITGIGIGIGITTLALAAALPRGAHAQEATDLQVHGFVSQGFMVTTDNNYLGHSERGSFEFFEVGLNVSKELGHDVRVGLQVFAQDLGPLGNYEPIIDWAMVDWRINPSVGVRVGRIKLPLGLFNENWDVDIARTPVLLPQSVYGVRFRDVLNAVNGGALYGNLQLGGAGALDWTAYVGTVYVPPHLGEYDVENVVGGRVLWQSPIDGLRAGGHVLYSNFHIADEVADMRISANYNNWLQLGASAEYVAGPLTVTAEYRKWTADVDYDPALIEPERYQTDGGYLMAQVQATDRLYFSGYYSMNFEDISDRKNPDDYHKDAALGVRFDLTPEWTVKAEGHYIDGRAELEGRLNPDGKTRRWGLFMAKTSLAF